MLKHQIIFWAKLNLRVLLELHIIVIGQSVELWDIGLIERNVFALHWCKDTIITTSFCFLRINRLHFLISLKKIFVHETTCHEVVNTKASLSDLSAADLSPVDTVSQPLTRIHTVPCTIHLSVPQTQTASSLHSLPSSTFLQSSPAAFLAFVCPVPLEFQKCLRGGGWGL